MAMIKTKKPKPRRRVRILTKRSVSSRHGLAPRSIHTECEPPDGLWAVNNEYVWIDSRKLDKGLVKLTSEQYKVVGLNTDRYEPTKN